MAISRMQQYQQLVNKPANGKRPGYRGQGSKEDKDNRQSYNAAQAAANVGRASTAGSMNRADPFSVGFDAREAQKSKQYSGITPTDDRGNIIDITAPPKKPKKEETNFQKFKRTFNPFPLATAVFNKLSTSKFAMLNNAMQRKKYLENLQETDPKAYDEVMQDLATMGYATNIGPMDVKMGKEIEFTDLGEPQAKAILGEGYENYLNRFKTEDTGRDRDRDDTPMDPCKGPNPPAYCFIGQNADDNMEAAVTRNLSGLTPRIGGSIFDFTQFAADGGRIGLKGGADAATESFSKSAGSSRPGKKGSVNVGAGGATFNPGGRDEGPDDRSTFEQTVNQRKIVNEARKQKEEAPSNFRKFLRTAKDKTQGIRDIKFLRDLITGNIPGAAINLGSQFIPISQTGIATPNLVTGNIVYDERLGLIDATTGEPVDITMPGAQQIKTYSTGDIKNLLGIKDKATAEKFVTDPFIGAPKFLTREDLDQKNRTQAEAMDLFRENLIKQETDYPSKTFDQQRSGAMEMGIRPEDRGLIPSDFLDKPGEAVTQTPFDTMAKDIVREYDLADGGMAGLDREAFLLGGIAKGLKKAVRGVKKIAKSPIGKAALLGAGMFGIPGTTFGGLLGRASFGNAAQGMFGSFGPVSALKKLGIMKTQFPGYAERVGLLSKLNLPMAGIFGASALAGLMTPKQDDGFNTDQYYADNKLNPNAPLNKRIAGSEFDFYGGQLAADGGRIGYQEGSKEPVAKKTLPLIDMDGMEKDYRETGGFVEMGRMEKADDVPARLSKNEFVFTADAVRNAGDGDIDKGAEVMYNMMKNLEAGGEVSEESQGLEGAREMFKTSQRLGEVL
jgi:hypothetical protein